RSLGLEPVRADALLRPGDFGAVLDGRPTHDARSPQRGLRDPPDRHSGGPRRSSVVRRDVRGGGDPRRGHDRPREPPRETPGGNGPETLTPRPFTGAVVGLAALDTVLLADVLLAAVSVFA